MLVDDFVVQPVVGVGGEDGADGDVQLVAEAGVGGD